MAVILPRISMLWRVYDYGLPPLEETLTTCGMCSERGGLPPGATLTNSSAHSTSSRDFPVNIRNASLYLALVASAMSWGTSTPSLAFRPSFVNLKSGLVSAMLRGKTRSSTSAVDERAASKPLHRRNGKTSCIIVNDSYQFRRYCLSKLSWSRPTLQTREFKMVPINSP